MGDSVSEDNNISEDDNKHNGFFVWRDEAYEMGVEEASPYPVIYIDPDAIYRRAAGCNPSSENADPEDCDPRIVGARTLKNQLESQIPGATETLVDFFGRRAEALGKPRPSLEEIAEYLRDLKSPMAFSESLHIDGREYSFAASPPGSLNSKGEIVDSMIEGLGLSWKQESAIYDNIPGTNNDWMRFMGNHEGTHLQVNHYTKMTELDVLIEERRADQGAYDMARERGQEDIALAWKDLRSLHGEKTHATTPLVDQDDQVTEITYETARDYRGGVNALIEQNFDFAEYVSSGEGKATKADALFRENPEAYFAAAQQAVDKVRDEAVADYNDNSALFDHQRAVIEAQLLIDYHKSFEDAYRRRVLGEDLPYRQPTQLMSQEAEDTYIENMELHEKVKAMHGTFFGFVSYDSEFHKDRAFEKRVEGELDLTLEEKGQVVLDYLEDKKDAVVENFRNNPSKETYKHLMECQMSIDEAVDVINYSRGKKGGEPMERVELMSLVEKQELLIEAFDAGVRAAELNVAISKESQAHWNEIYDKAFAEEGGTIFASFDWENYEGQATNSDVLYREDPEAYFEHTYEVLGAMRQEALEACESDPSYENIGRLIEVQILLDTTNSSLIENDGEDGFDMDSVNVPFELSIDAPDLVPKEAMELYYTERVERAQKAEAEPDKGYEKGVNGGAYTTKVDGEVNGKPTVKFNGDRNSIETENGKPMTQVFDEAAAPDAKSVALVDPKVDEVQDVPTPPPVDPVMEANQTASI